VSIEDNKRVVADFVEVCQNQHNLTASDSISEQALGEEHRESC